MKTCYGCGSENSDDNTAELTLSFVGPPGEHSSSHVFCGECVEVAIMQFENIQQTNKIMNAIRRHVGISTQPEVKQ